jgi:hypothetical protein
MSIPPQTLTLPGAPSGNNAATGSGSSGGAGAGKVPLPMSGGPGFGGTGVGGGRGTAGRYSGDESDPMDLSDRLLVPDMPTLAGLEGKGSRYRQLWSLESFGCH